MSDLPFDMITVTVGVGVRKFTVPEFLALPLDERVQAILFGRIGFLRANQVVDTNAALTALRKFEAHQRK